jgi:hypothetical protein
MLIETIKTTLGMLKRTLEAFTDDAYSQPLQVLSGATIGQHVRHVAEMYVCLFEGIESGMVCYENRKRDLVIENSKMAAIHLIENIAQKVERPDTNLTLNANYEMMEMTGHRIPTNYLRELAYNLEHTIHHMALIKIGIREISDLSLENNFGVAPSTIRYQNQKDSYTPIHSS